MNWLEAIPTILIALVVVLLPGYLLAWVVGLRGFWRVGLAAPISVSGYAMASFVLQKLGAAWTASAVLGFMAALAMVLALLFRVLFRRPVTQPRPPCETTKTVAVFAGVCLGAFLLAYRIAQGIGDPHNISQTFDNVFHLNALRFVLDTGSASPMTIGEVNAPGAAGFYPSAWHALTSLVVMLSGASIPVAVSAVSVVVGSLVVTLSFALMARQLLGHGATVMVSVGVVVAAFPSFPMLLLFFGVLYPLFLGIALVPAALAVLASALGIGGETSRLGLSTAGRWILLAGLVPGIMLAHPGAFLAALAAAVPLVLVWALRGWRELSSRVKLIRGVSLGAFLAAGATVYWLARPPISHAVWRPTTQFQDGVVQAVTLTMRGASVSLVLIALVLGGVVVALRRRRSADLVLLGMYVVFVLLYAAAAGIDNVPARYALVGPWYSDIPRMAAFIPIAAIPLAALGLASLIDWASTKLAETPQRSRFIYPSAILIVVLSVLGTQGTSMLSMATQMRTAYESDLDSKLVSSDERALLSRLPDEVPEGATIAGSSWTGAGMAYALSDRRVLMTHTFMADNEDLALINAKLNQATSGSAVCAAMARENVKFVLDFGEREVHGGRHEFVGLERLESSPAVKLVDEEGEARLYEVVGCG